LDQAQLLKGDMAVDRAFASHSVDLEFDSLIKSDQTTEKLGTHSFPA